MDKKDKKIPLISVIIPCYNTEKYLNETIDSVLSQTFGDFEIIIVNDGSTDNTEKIALSYSDPKIKYIKQTNKGLAGARNTGIRNSSGKYLTFLDSDDTFLPNKLSSQSDFLETHPEFDLVAGGYIRIDENSKFIYSFRPLPNSITLEDVIIKQVHNISHNTLIKRTSVEKINGYDENFKAAEDIDFDFRLIISGCRMYQMNNIVCAYRLNSIGMCSNVERQTKAVLSSIEKIFTKDFLPEKLLKYKNQHLSTVYLQGVAQSYYKGNIELGKQYLTQVFKLEPEIDKDEHKKIRLAFVNLILSLNINSPEKYLNTILDNLPTEASILYKYKKIIIYDGLLRYAMLLWFKKEYFKLIKTIFILIIKNPFLGIYKLGKYIYLKIIIRFYKKLCDFFS